MRRARFVAQLLDAGRAEAGTAMQPEDVADWAGPARGSVRAAASRDLDKNLTHCARNRRLGPHPAGRCLLKT